MSATLRGFAFPFRIAPARAPQGGTASLSNSGIAASEGFRKIEEDLRHLLSTRLGERTMLRSYGGGVHHRLQEPNDSTLRAVIQHEIEEGLRAYAPGVRLASPIGLQSEGGELTITMEYVGDPSRALQRAQLVVI